MFLLSGTSAPWTGQIIVTEEEPAGRNSNFNTTIYSSHILNHTQLQVALSFMFCPSENVVPGRPCELQVTEATKNYVVLSWKPPGEKGLEGVMYYVEKVCCMSLTTYSLFVYTLKKSETVVYVHVSVMHLYLCLSVCLWHRQLAEGEHWDPSQVSSLCSFRSRWGEVLQIPCPMLQLRRCRWTFWPDWSYHSWRQAWSDSTQTYMHVVFTFIVNDLWWNVHCSGPQISLLHQAKLFPLETQTRQSLCLGKLRMMPKSWLDTTLKVVLWAAKCGSHATTSLWMQPGKIIIIFTINYMYTVLPLSHFIKNCICRFICHGLTTGEKYVFRVRAVNAAGLSQFSQESEPVEVKAAIGE